MSPRFCISCFSLHLLLYLLCFNNLDASPQTDTLHYDQYLFGPQTLVSKGGTFQIGFFTPGKPHKQYIGIWYSRRPDKTVVWVANRSSPVLNATLTISGDGNLVLLDESKTQTWSTGLPPRARNSTVAVLLETGNLVVADSSDASTIYWQSFEHPTDTWLPGGRIGWNAALGEYVALTSWRAPDDPAPGYYSYGVDPHGSSQMVQAWNRSETYWLSGEWNSIGHYFSSIPEMMKNNIFNYTYAPDGDYLTYSISESPGVSPFYTRFVAEPLGEGMQWAWLENSTAWIVVWRQPGAQCQVYSLCGPFGFCAENSVPLCNCLPGFKPADAGDWSYQFWSGGCIRRTQLKCENRSNVDEDRFLPMQQVELPTGSETSVTRSGAECELACLKDCSCGAYAFEGAECQLWRGSLRDLKSPISAGGENGTIYLRLAASELPTANSPHSGTKNGLKIGIAAGSAGGLTLLVILILVVARGRRRGRLTRLSNWASEGSLMLFSYRDLRDFTKNFSERLGGGGFGSVFKGELADSTAIAVKKLEGFRQGEKQFRAEVSTLGAIQHVNLARLRGFCCEADKRLLVYDYMPNGSLDSIVFSADSAVLSWEVRYKIAIGTARGMAYLHDECRDCIVHCDIKPENILVDKDYTAKVTDFGMAKLIGRDVSRVLTTMRGTVGYIAPEWISGLPITPKADVYSYGMLLFELISGRRNVTKNVNCERRIPFFPIFAATKVASSDDEVLGLLDPRLERNADVVELRRACGVACWCIQDYESERPTMVQVLQMLEGVTEVPVAPVPVVLQVMADNAGSPSFTSELSSDPFVSGSGPH